jgi:hypothetical protein
VGSLEEAVLRIIVVLIDIFKATAIVDKKLSCHTMAKRLLFETFELNDRFGVDFWSTGPRID